MKLDVKNKKTLNLMREKLIRNHNLLLEDKNRTAGALTQNLDEQSIIIESDEVIDKLDRLEVLELNKIMHALKKIENGSYGFCIACSKRIHRKRLKALPQALTCLKCAEELKDFKYY